MPTHAHTADHTHTINETPHNHTTAALYGTTGDGVDAPPYNIAGVGYAATPIALVNAATTGITINSASVTTSNQGAGQAHNNMQPYIVLNYIVKVK
jgi:microcystin-dependent protein